MAETPKNINDEIVLSGRLYASPGKGDEVAQTLANIKARADSDAEPGTLLFQVVRWGEVFVVWEKYADQAAVEAHMTESVVQFQQSGLFEVKDKGIFFPANSLPLPSL